MRILIVDDGYHDEFTIGENGEVSDPKSLLRFYGKMHNENYEIKVAYIGKIWFFFEKTHPDFTSTECESIVLNMFEHLSTVDCPEFTPSFNELWELAY